MGLGSRAVGANVLTPREATWYSSLMTSENYRRIAPLYWLVDAYGNYFDTSRYTKGFTAFCFFDSGQYAADFLRRWVEVAQSSFPEGRNPLSGEPISLDDWGIRHSDNAEQLLAMCDELSRLDNTPPYNGFFINPPWDPNSAELPMTPSEMKDEIERRAAQP